MNVALISPEFYSLARRTNLASVTESLARALHTEGAKVCLFIPRCADMDESLLLGATEVARVTVQDHEFSDTEFIILHLTVAGIPTYVFDNERWFNKHNPYGNDEGPYPDNWRRYALFSQAVLESFAAVDFKPGILQCMDWTTGLIPVYQYVNYSKADSKAPVAKAVTWFSIHNLAMQGIYERDILARINIPHEEFKVEGGVALDGKVNFLKAGADYATVIGTHSGSHADRIQMQDRGHGLETLFLRRKKELVGISNGIDYAAWDPSKDPILSANFSATDKDPIKGKLKCKADLQKALGLDNGPRQPIAALIGRWDADSGFDLLANLFPDILERGIQLVILGTGPAELTAKMKNLESTFKGRCKIVEGFTPHIAHQLMGGADIMILPSHYQPSNPMYAIGMRYGVVPIIYSKGGLDDKVLSVSASKTGTGFTFEPYTGGAVIDALEEALAIYKNAAEWKRLVRRCLAEDFSWKRTAAEYIKAYRRVTRRARATRNEY
jgi:starch synthase